MIAVIVMVILTKLAQLAIRSVIVSKYTTNNTLKAKKLDKELKIKVGLLIRK